MSSCEASRSVILSSKFNIQFEIRAECLLVIHRRDIWNDSSSTCRRAIVPATRKKAKLEKTLSYEMYDRPGHLSRLTGEDSFFSLRGVGLQSGT